MTTLAFLGLVMTTGQDPDAAHRNVFEKTAGSVVALRALAPLGERSGTGVILSRDGLVLTSYAICPEGSTHIRVWTRGPRLYDAELVGTSKKDELALVRIKPRGDLTPIEFGESSRVRIGDPSYTIGNAANSIILDDQPSFNAGIVSGAYALAEPRAGSTWAGPVLETTAAINVGMEGAPCLDAGGRMIGFATLNYSPNRFLGAVIPIDALKDKIEILKLARAADPLPEGGEGTLGLRAKNEGGRVVVDHVDPDGPAARAGLRKGDTILQVADVPLKSEKDLADRLKGMEAGSVVWLKIETGGETETLKIILEKKK